MTARRAVKALPRADDLVPDDEETRLQFILDALYRRALLEVHFLTRDALPVDPATFRLDDETTNAVLQVSAERAVGMTETTRAAVDAILRDGQREGLGTEEIAAKLQGLFETTWKYRPDVIARTEIAEAQRVSAINRYKATGLVDRVKIRDGDKDEPCAGRNGTTVALDDAPELAHPQCTLVLIPVLRDGVV